ncbi:MFS multidrug transporter [Mycena galopus ATCC 62051]|nr:MFS multidrug transporter [Mycena galopus ATCC 62051]
MSLDATHEKLDPEAVKTDSEVNSEVHAAEFHQDLKPTPSDSPADPLNWSSWKKNAILIIVSIHAMQGPFSAAIVIPSLQLLAAEFNITLTQATYIASIQIICLGVFPFIWSPIACRIGRRPVYLISALGSAIFALAGGFCNSYGVLMATRAIQSMFISSAQSLGGPTVADLFFAHEKGRKMGIWVLLVTIGPCLGPLIVSYLVQYHGWRAAFYLLAPIHLALFFAHLCFAPETLYLNRRSGRRGWRSYFAFKVYDSRPITLKDVGRPLVMIFRPIVFLSALAYSITFSYTNVLMTNLIPQVFGEKFHLGPGQMSLQFISLLIGGVLGEQLAGYGSDLISNWRTKRAGGRRVPEFRLTLAFPGFLIAIVGVVGYRICNSDLRRAGGCVTYAIESYSSETVDVSAFFAFMRQLYAFTAPFYFPIAFESMGNAKAAGIFAGIIGVGFLMVISCNVLGPTLRDRR